VIGATRAAATLAMLVTSLGLALSCATIEGRALSRAPLNVCPENPCERFAPGPRTRAACTSRRCEFPGRPDFPFRIAITVPTTSFYAPGQTFLMTSEDLFGTAAVVDSPCRPPQCLALPLLGQAIGSYRFTNAAADALRLPLGVDVSVPVRVTFVPLVGGVGRTTAIELGLPLDTRFATSQWQPRETGTDPVITYSHPLPAGRYLRFMYPQPPYDAFLPPAEDEVRVVQRLNDDVVLDVIGTVPLDDPDGTSRVTHVARAEGLEGFRVWLADAPSGRRISAVRELTGTRDQAVLATTRQSAEGTTALRDDVDVVLAPAQGWIAVPRLQSRLLGGQGLGTQLAPLEYPPVPPPATITGVIAQAVGNGAELLQGIAGRLQFQSTQLRRADGVTSQLLRYETVVSTDENGRFSTVLPVGVYDVLVEPAEGTGFGKIRAPLEVLEGTATTFHPPVRTVTVGRAVTGDGRPLSDAEVIAIPVRRTTEAASPIPRPGRTRTRGSGDFELELDQGAYAVSVLPQEGSGFPRVVTLTSVGGTRAELPPIEIPPPTRLTFSVREPSRAANPVAYAVVRIFAEPPGGGPPVEMGRALTGPDGGCEILLAQQPR
jgi:hypothetical protein